MLNLRRSGRGILVIRTDSGRRSVGRLTKRWTDGRQCDRRKYTSSNTRLSPEMMICICPVGVCVCVGKIDEFSIMLMIFSFFWSIHTRPLHLVSFGVAFLERLRYSWYMYLSRGGFLTFSSTLFIVNEYCSTTPITFWKKFWFCISILRVFYKYWN